MMTARSNNRNVTGAIVTTRRGRRSVFPATLRGKPACESVCFRLRSNKPGQRELADWYGRPIFGGARLPERHGFAILRFVHFVKVFVPGVLNWQSKRREAT